MNRPEGFFVVVAFVFGFIFIVTIPPFQTPDEYIHFYRSYEVSELKIPRYNDSEKGSGSQLPSSIKRTEAIVRGKSNQIRFNPREKYDHRLTKIALFDVPLNKNDRSFYDTTASTMQYFPPNYAPQAASIAVARIFNAPVVLMVYIVRLSNLLLWLALGFIAIKLFPWKKWSLAGILLIPIMVAQSISPGLDVMVYGSALLFMSLIFRAYAHKLNLSKWQIFLLIVLATLMLFGKLVCIAFLPLILLLNFKNNSPKTAFIIKTILILAPFALYILWSSLTSGSNPSASSGDSIQQIQSLTASPFTFVIELLSTFGFVWGDAVTQSLIGNFGWLDTPLSAPFVCIGAVMLAFYLLAQYEKPNRLKIRPTHRYLFIGIALVYFIGTSLAMYVYSSETELKYITGIQGRYFMPLLVLGIPIFYTSFLTVRKHHFIRFSKVASISLLLISQLTIFLRYYVSYFP